MAGIFQKGWDALGRANSSWKDRTQPITGQTLQDRLQKLQSYFKMDAAEQAKLAALIQDKKGKSEKGEAFLLSKVNDVNRYASHRIAFVANAFIQLLLVNLSTITVLSFMPAFYFKAALVGVNLLVALLAWRRIRASRKQLLLGPSQKPKWSIWGIFRGNRRKHNKHIKNQAQPYKIRMRDERFFMMVYLLNAITIFFASQLIFANYLPSILQGIIGIPVFILSLLFALPNAYWGITANNQVVKAATKRGSQLDKMKL